MTLPSSGPISLGDIGNEFGRNHPIIGNSTGNEVSLGNYRKIGTNQSNYPQNIGDLSFASIDAISGGSVPTGTAEIKASHFRGTRLQQVVNFHGSGRGGTRLNARNRYDAGGSNDVDVVGGFRTRPSNSSNTRVYIHVNQQIASENNNVNHVALRTGSWNPSTTLSVDVGPSGRIQGSGGRGGNGSSGNGDGGPAGNGSSGLGIEYSETAVNVESGGVIAAGYGGGGGGSGGEQTDKAGTRTSGGGGGGGGAGLPPGAGGSAGANGGRTDKFQEAPNAGDPGSSSGGTFGSGTAGNPGTGGNNDNETVGATGGEGGQHGNTPDAGGSGDGNAGPAGLDGDAIRRTNNNIVVDINGSDAGRILGSGSNTGNNAISTGVA